MQPTPRIEGFRGEFLWELEIAERQLTAMAEAIPAAKYDWRPHENARSVSEVLVHVAAGNLLLLEVIGLAAPLDLYAGVTTEAEDRFRGMVRRNEELEKSIRDKAAVAGLLQRSLQTVRQAITAAGDAELGRPCHFFREVTTVRRVYLRLLTHTHEHMGQMIAYLRTIGRTPPSPDRNSGRRPA
jgi:uncharacterized damage-inducible protein DinB